MRQYRCSPASRWGVSFAVLIALSVPAQALADESEAEDSTAIVVKADRAAEAALPSKALSVTVGAEQIAATNAVNAEDALRYAPSLLVRKRYAGDANATLSFRNMHTTQTPRALVTVDGFVISNFLGASFFTAPKWAVLGPDDIGSVAIAYGPTSARLSGHAAGGALGIATRPITESGPRVSAQMFGQSYSYYETDEDLFGWAVDAGYDLALGDKGGLSLAYRRFENSGQPQEWRTVTAGSPYADQALVDPELSFLKIGAQDSVADSREDQIRLRGSYELGKGWTLRTLAALLIDAEDTLKPKSFLTDSGGNPTFIGISGISVGTTRSTDLLAGLGLQGTLGGWATNLAYSRFDALSNEERRSDPYDSVTGLAPQTGRIGKNDSGWTNADLRFAKTVGLHGFSFGLSSSRYRDENIAWATNDWATGAKGAVRDGSGGTTALYGAFAEDAVQLSRDVTVTMGLRAEQWRASGGYLVQGVQEVAYASRKEWAFSPKTALAWAVDGATTVTLSAALATRFPTVRELYQPGLIAYGPGVGELDLNGFNPDLAAEKVADFQITAARHMGKAKLTLNAYRQDVRDAIFAQSLAIPDAVTGNLVQSSLITNIGKVRTWGADAVLQVHDAGIEGLDFDANLAWTDVTITENAINPALEGNRFPRVPEWRFNASLRYSPSDNWSLAANFRSQSTPDRNLENNATSLCSTFYCVTRFGFVDLKASRRFGPIELSVGVDNALNEKAFVYHPYPGRSVVLGLKWKGAGL